MLIKLTKNINILKIVYFSVYIIIQTKFYLPFLYKIRCSIIFLAPLSHAF